MSEETEQLTLKQRAWRVYCDNPDFVAMSKRAFSEAINAYEQARRDSLPQDRVERVAFLLWRDESIRSANRPRTIGQWNDESAETRGRWQRAATVALLAADDVEAVPKDGNLPCRDGCGATSDHPHHSLLCPSGPELLFPLARTVDDDPTEGYRAHRTRIPDPPSGGSSAMVGSKRPADDAEALVRRLESELAVFGRVTGTHEGSMVLLEDVLALIRHPFATPTAKEGT